MAIRGAADIVGPYGRLGRDGRAGHMETQFGCVRKFTFTSSLAAPGAFELCAVPPNAFFTHAIVQVTTAFGGTTPTMKVGFFNSSAGTADDDDALIDANDVSLGSAGRTSVVDKLGIINPGSFILGLTLGAGAADNAAGAATIAVGWQTLTDDGALAF